LVCPSCCSGSGGVEVCVEGGFTDGIGEEIQGIGNELSGVGEGEREGAIGAGAIQQEREPAVVGVDGIGLARCGVCRVEAEDGVGIVRKATALGGQENGGGSVEVLGARGVGVRVEGLRGELFASLEIASYKELLGDAQELLRPPPLAGGGRIHGLGEKWAGFWRIEERESFLL
jgi:hypothetical protein